jgi:transposase
MRVTLSELRRRYEESPDAETRTRYQMLLLSLRGQTSSQIASTVLRSQDTVECVLKRYLAGGLDAVPRRTAPGRERTVTAARARRIVTRDRDGSRMKWDRTRPTGRAERLAQYLGQHAGILVTEETVRLYLRAHDYECLRPTWTLRRKAEQKADYVGNACG